MGLDSYLKTLASALLGQSPQQQPVPPQPQGGASSPSTAAPSQGGFMQSASNFIGNPLTQAALGGYFNAIGTPKLAGRGARISNLGLGALQGYNSAENAQLKQQEEQAALQQQQLATQTAQQKQAGIAALPANIQPYVQAGVPELAKTSMDKAGNLQYNSTVSGPAFLQAHPNDPSAAVVANSYMKDDSAVHPLKDYEDSLMEQKKGPGELQKQTAELAEINARTNRLKTQPNAGTIANWYDPETKQYYRGAQKSPGDVPASVATSAKSDQEVKARAAAWQKAYNDARNSFIKTNTKTEGFLNPTKVPPSEADADAYAKNQADAQVNALFGASGTPAEVAASGATSADEPSTAADDPLSLIPEGATPGMEGGVHGYKTSDGVFHPVE